MGENNDIENNQIDSHNLSKYVDQITTTSESELADIIAQGPQYGGTFVKIKIYGHFLLNQCATILTRKNHHIKGRIRHKFYAYNL